MLSKDAYAMLETQGIQQGLTGRKLKGFVKKRLRQIIKKLKRDGKLDQLR